MSVTIPVKTGGPAFPPYPSDATKYGLSMLGYFAAHAMAGLCSNPEVVDQAFIETMLAPSPAPTIAQPEPLNELTPGTPTALGLLEFMFNDNIVEPPGASNVQVDNLDQTLATKLWINKTTSDGIEANRPLIAINELYGIYMQDKDDSSRNMSYNVVGDAIDKGVYVELPVTFIEGGAPLPAQRILLSVYKLVAHSDLTPEVLAKIAYSIAAEMVQVRDQIPIEPEPVPTDQSTTLQTVGPPAADSGQQTFVTVGSAPAA